MKVSWLDRFSSVEVFIITKTTGLLKKVERMAGLAIPYSIKFLSICIEIKFQRKAKIVVQRTTEEELCYCLYVQLKKLSQDCNQWRTIINQSQGWPPQMKI